MNIINDEKMIVSVIGPHAGGGVEDIIKRKSNDIEMSGKTFWLVNSFHISPVVIQKFCENNSIYCYFISPVVKGGARNTIINDEALYYSTDLVEWNRFKNVGPVTGKIIKSTSVLVFDQLEKYEGLLNLKEYSYSKDCINDPVIRLGASTLALERKSNLEFSNEIKYRKVVYRARLVEPYCVFVKKEIKQKKYNPDKKTHKLDLTEDVLRELYENQCLSDGKIAEMYNCTEQNILGYRKRWGIETKSVKDKIKDQLSEDLITVQLACDKYNVRYDQLFKWICKDGLQIQKKISGISCYKEIEVVESIEKRKIPVNLIDTEEIAKRCGNEISRKNVVDVLNKLNIIGEKIGRQYYYDKELIENKLDKIKEEIFGKNKIKI